MALSAMLRPARTTASTALWPMRYASTVRTREPILIPVRLVRRKKYDVAAAARIPHNHRRPSIRIILLPIPFRG